MSQISGYGGPVPVVTRAAATGPALGYLKDQWYFTDSRRGAVGRVVTVTDTYVEVAVHRLGTAGDVGSEEARAASSSWVSGASVRQQINLTREALGKPPIQWTELTRARAGLSAERAEGLRAARQELHRDEEEVIEALERSEPELTDTAGAPDGRSITRKEVGASIRGIGLLPTLDAMLGAFEEQVRLEERDDQTPVFLDKLRELPVPSLAEYGRVLKKAIAKPDSRNVQDALFAAMGACQAEIRSARRIPDVVDIVDELQEPAEVIRERQHRARRVTEGAAQGDLLTGAFGPVRNAKLGRPRYLLTQDMLPDEHVVEVTRAVTNLDLPGLSPRDARRVLRPYLKTEDGSDKVRTFVAKAAEGRLRTGFTRE